MCDPCLAVETSDQNLPRVAVILKDCGGSWTKAGAGGRLICDATMKGGQKPLVRGCVTQKMTMTQLTLKVGVFTGNRIHNIQDETMHKEN